MPGNNVFPHSFLLPVDSRQYLGAGAEQTPPGLQQQPSSVHLSVLSVSFSWVIAFCNEGPTVRVTHPCGCIALAHNWFRLELFDRRSDVGKASCSNKRYSGTHSALEAALSGFDVRDFCICLKMVNEPVGRLSSMLLGKVMREWQRERQNKPKCSVVSEVTALSLAASKRFELAIYCLQQESPDTSTFTKS